MECPHHPVRIAAALALAASLTPLTAHADETRAPVTIELRGDDFPVLVQDSGQLPPLAEDGLPQPRGCEAVRARRIDELPWPWRDAIDRIHLDCEEIEVPSGDALALALTATAFLKPGRAWLAGHPVAEIRLMDSQWWGDHQYILAAPYEETAQALREHIERSCATRHMREENSQAPDCQMHETDRELYLEVEEISGVWVHADPDDPGRTVYAEGWTD